MLKHFSDYEQKELRSWWKAIASLERFPRERQIELCREFLRARYRTPRQTREVSNQRLLEGSPSESWDEFFKRDDVRSAQMKARQRITEANLNEPVDD